MIATTLKVAVAVLVGCALTVAGAADIAAAAHLVDPARPQATQDEAPFRLPEQARPTHTEIYKKVGDVSLRMFLFRPADWRPSDSRPAIVFFFGGGWGGGDVRRLMPYAEYLAARGMVAACVDYRVKSRHKTTPAECVEDAKSAIRWLRANAAGQGVDPQRIVAAGDSAGGHLAACTALAEGFDYAGDPLAGVSAEANALVLFNPVLDAVAEEKRDGRIGSLELARSMSPNLLVRPGLPPTLVLHGTHDRRVPFQQAEVFFERMRAVGNEVVLWPAQGVGHSFWTQSPWREAVLQPIEAFLGSHGYLPAPAP